MPSRRRLAIMDHDSFRSTSPPGCRSRDRTLPMIKLIFRPFAVVATLIAGMIGKRLFQRLWGLLDDKHPPRTEERSTPIGKLALALAVEGALFRLVKGLADHGSRRAFAHMTGAWPGEQAESPKASTTDR